MEATGARRMTALLFWSATTRMLASGAKPGRTASAPQGTTDHVRGTATHVLVFLCVWSDALAFDDDVFWADMVPTLVSARLLPLCSLDRRLRVPVYSCTDCTVCDTDYSPTLAHTCTRCSSSRRQGLVAAVVIGAIAAVFAIAIICQYMLSAELEDSRARRFHRRVLAAVPVQALKIIVVVWQIVTQVPSHLPSKAALLWWRTFWRIGEGARGSTFHKQTGVHCSQKCGEYTND